MEQTETQTLSVPYPSNLNFNRDQGFQFPKDAKSIVASSLAYHEFPSQLLRVFIHLFNGGFHRRHSSRV